LNNALKHSAASNVKIEMVLNRADFEILITDNGRGFEVPPPFASNGSPHASQDGHRGYGLKNMRQRLADIGGECLIRSPLTREGGTVVSMRIHLDGHTEVKT
jgi:signal transduction histidine kinase